MSDNLEVVKPEDPTQINIHQVWEVKYWCQELCCTEHDLKEAVNAVGTSVERVKRYLCR